jgi:NADH-quinone oxidoreductase subunit N
MMPELILIAVACALLLIGVSRKASSRRLAAMIALLAVVVVFAHQLWTVAIAAHTGSETDASYSLSVGSFATYVKLLVSGVGILLILLAWPTNADATGSSSMNVGGDTGEFFALMLLSISGVFLVASSNDLILLFLGIELASIPTYIMVSISRPLPVAQEAGVKYFFLGAMAAAIMLFGFSYLYGTTGYTRLDQISRLFHSATNLNAQRQPADLNSWQQLAVVMLLGGFAFKIAAVPLHAYAGDVYQGAATPVTAFLAFIPKTSGFVAIIKLLSAVGGPHWAFPPLIIHLLWVLAALTMSVGNVLGLLQLNVKRVFAYSSVAHSGYMLVGLTALASAASSADAANSEAIQQAALQGVLFYLAAYGIMNVAAFGVLMLLPSRAVAYAPPGSATPEGAALVSMPATSAETFDDLAGAGKRHVGLGLAMAVSCFSLIGLPTTIGFFGKFYLIKPALQSGLLWLVVITMINAAISAAYYLRIVATMFLRPSPDELESLSGEARPPAAAEWSLRSAMPIAVAVMLSVAGTLIFGIVFPATNSLTGQVTTAAHIDSDLFPAVPITSRPKVTEAPAATPVSSPPRSLAGR